MNSAEHSENSSFLPWPQDLTANSRQHLGINRNRNLFSDLKNLAQERAKEPRWVKQVGSLVIISSWMVATAMQAATTAAEHGQRPGYHWDAGGHRSCHHH